MLTNSPCVSWPWTSAGRSTQSGTAVSFINWSPKLAEVYNWIRNFYDHRCHCTRFGGELSDILNIFASVIQGSALGPASYVDNTGDLRPVTIGNEIIKYADDTYLIVPAENTSSCQPELDNISHWASDNNLRLNQNKTFSAHVVTVAHWPYFRQLYREHSTSYQHQSPWHNHHQSTFYEPIHGITLYGLRVLRALGSDDCIQEVFRSIVTAKLSYASQAWSGFCTASDINKLDRFLLARCKRHNYCSQTIPSIAEQFDKADQSLFRTVLYMHNHVMHRLL